MPGELIIVAVCGRVYDSAAPSRDRELPPHQAVAPNVLLQANIKKLKERSIRSFPIPVPQPLQADMKAVSDKARVLAEQAQAARLGGVPAARAWKWALTLEVQ